MPDRAARRRPLRPEPASGDVRGARCPAPRPATSSRCMGDRLHDRRPPAAPGAGRRLLRRPRRPHAERASGDVGQPRAPVARAGAVSDLRSSSELTLKLPSTSQHDGGTRCRRVTTPAVAQPEPGQHLQISSGTRWPRRDACASRRRARPCADEARRGGRQPTAPRRAERRSPRTAPMQSSATMRAAGDQHHDEAGDDAISAPRRARSLGTDRVAQRRSRAPRPTHRSTGVRPCRPMR